MFVVGCQSRPTSPTRSYYQEWHAFGALSPGLMLYKIPLIPILVLGWTWSVIAILSFTTPLVKATSTGSHWEGMYFCKCICFATNYTILPIYRPTNPQKPCLTCTKQWCLDQKLQMCIGADIGGTDPDTGTGKEGDVEGRCFQRDSPRDQLVVTLFLLVVFGLLLGAAVRGRMEKAGLRLNAPLGAATASRSWWEFYLPSRAPPLLHVYSTGGHQLESQIDELNSRHSSSDLLPLTGSSRGVTSSAE